MSTRQPKGISGFGIIVIIIVLLIIAYVAYQIGRLQFSYGSIKGKVENAAEMGPAQSDDVIINSLLSDAAEAKVQLIPDSIVIDHNIPDSFRIYVAYDDSSNIFGLSYRRHFVIDMVKPIKVRF